MSPLKHQSETAMSLLLASVLIKVFIIFFALIGKVMDPSAWVEIDRVTEPTRYVDVAASSNR
ncbi:hypothetical protein [Novipirellula artificiosorum]|uniref:Uncharacterized protein n=1 Tax=Novipirellula artificiosorum TaxID=2528016 RepID=A0A5C6D4F0_9BACT|nr:hypothetical protein [Novipirellula artificiosorum]TWU31772.1 hypothetical protein Poly41_60070 [Novipirellula artificiosorum]